MKKIIAIILGMLLISSDARALTTFNAPPTWVSIKGAITTGDCVQFGGGNTLSDSGSACGGGGGSVSISNSDGTITLSPNPITGTGTASLNLSNANTWLAAQTYTNSDFLLLGSSTGKTTFASANAGATNYTVTIPAATDTLAELAATQTLTNKTISGASNTISSIGNTSLTNSATTVNSQTCTLGSTCTVTVAASTGITGLGTGVATALGNTLNAASGLVGFSGALGTPTSGTLTNATGFPAASLAGTSLPAGITTASGLTSVSTIATGVWAGTIITGTYGGTGVNNGSFQLTVPATGTADLIGTAQSITAAKTFSNSDILLLGSSTGATTLTSANSGASNFTLTLPAVTSTLATLAANTFSALQTFASGLNISGGFIQFANYTANTGTSYAVNLDNGGRQIITVTGAVAITLTRTNGTDTRIKFLEDGTGHVYSITGCKWAGGTAITYSTAANAYDIVSIWYDGTNYNCMGGAAFN